MENTILNPIAIGGLGGSGTRLIASILMNADVYIGGCLNKALDNLWFSTLFRRSETPDLTDMEFGNLARIFINVMTERRPFSIEEKKIIEKLSLEDRGRGNDDSVRVGGESMLATIRQPANRGSWGWKEPNTHLVIDKWYSIYPEMKYIHVTRNGLDMAFSSNQNQLKLWGKHLLGSAYQVTPRNSLRFWCAVHRKLFALMPTMGRNFYLLRYDDFCSDPDTALESLFEFLELRYPEGKKQTLRKLIVPPQSMGRHKSHRLDEFDTEDVEFVRSLGFEV